MSMGVELASGVWALYSGGTPQENDFPFSSRHHWPTAPQLRVEPPEPLPNSCWVLTGLICTGLEPVTPAVVKWWVQRLGHVQKTAFHISPQASSFAHPSSLNPSREGWAPVVTYSQRFGQWCVAALAAQKRLLWEHRWSMHNDKCLEGSLLGPMVSPSLSK